MEYLLDTDHCVYVLRGREPQVRRRLQLVRDSDVAISAVTKAEMYSGAARSEQPAQTRATQEWFFARFASLPFDDAAAEAYGRLDGMLKMRGMGIGPLDTQIAAIALVHNLTLVTHNIRHFGRIPYLVIEDWTVG